MATVTTNSPGLVRVRRSDLPYVSVKDYGAVGDGTTDDTEAIQAALDSPGLAPVIFPKGLYKCTGSGAAVFTLTKNRNIIGLNRSSTIRIDSAGADTDFLKIAITDNDGFLDVRGWQLLGLRAFFNGGGRHGLHIAGGLPLLNAVISDCSIPVGSNALGYSIYVIDQLAHSSIEKSEFSTAYMQCHDANVIRKCMTFGSGVAITFDCIAGVRNNTVQDNTLVNRDGAMHIINGDNIRFINNQNELAQGYTPVENQSATSSMIFIEGVARPVMNTVIKENNFGGGTSLDHSIYVGNATDTVIDENNFLSTNVAEVYLTANAKNTFIGNKNKTTGTVSNPRLRRIYKENVTDLGVGNMGVRKLGSGIAATDWTASDFVKDESGMVRFLGTFSAGTVTGGTVMANMPQGFRPYFAIDETKRNLLTYTEQLDNAAWSKSSTTITANAAASPDGETTADRLIATATTAAHFCYSQLLALEASTEYVFSAYFKRSDGASANVIRIEINDYTALKWIRATLNLTDGTTVISRNATYFSAATISSVDAGDGYWRVVIVATTTASGNSADYALLVTPNDVASVYTSYAGDVDVHRVLAWGFQIEEASAVSLYQRVVDAGTFETVFETRQLIATTDAGVGYVNISAAGVISAGSLPSNVAVGIESFQSVRKYE